ncbi:MAG TPA: hypothetical protein ENK38_04340 [Gammaproteobacteria bacterium]|nr:hypothetical protein [Gammaproteobacteria bacterium]
MKTIYLLAAASFFAISNPILAEEDQHSEKPEMKMDSSMPMHDKEQCEMMAKMNQKKMKGMMQMKKKHMQTMENHLANIEELLKQLVEIQKQKNAAQ